MIGCPCAASAHPEPLREGHHTVQYHYKLCLTYVRHRVSEDCSITYLSCIFLTATLQGDRKSGSLRSNANTSALLLLERQGVPLVVQSNLALADSFPVLRRE